MRRARESLQQKQIDKINDGLKRLTKEIGAGTIHNQEKKEEQEGNDSHFLIFTQ